MRCFILQNSSLNFYSCLNLHGSTQLIIWQPLALSTLPRANGSKICIFHLMYKSMREFEWSVQIDWKKKIKKILKKQKNTCRRAAFLKILQVVIIFQRFSCIRKLIFQGNFCRYIQNIRIQNISLKDRSFHISINSLSLYLSRKLAEFSLRLVYIYPDWETFSKLWCSHS